MFYLSCHLFTFTFRLVLIFCQFGKITRLSKGAERMVPLWLSDSQTRDQIFNTRPLILSLSLYLSLSFYSLSLSLSLSHSTRSLSFSSLSLCLSHSTLFSYPLLPFGFIFINSLSLSMPMKAPPIPPIITPNSGKRLEKCESGGGGPALLPLCLLGEKRWGDDLELSRLI